MMIIVFLTILVTAFAESGALYCCGDGEFDYKTSKCLHDINVTTSISLTCNETIQIPANFTYSENGGVILMSPPGMELDPGTFCVANKTGNDRENALVFCLDEEEQMILDEKVLGYCMFVSAFFLTLTAIIYSILPEVRDLQGKSIINFCICLTLGLFTLSIMKTMPYSNMNLCAIRGFLVYFFLLASFFWTNCISIQTLVNLRRPTVSDYSYKPFVWYALYAWGCPSLLTIGMAVVNFYPGSHVRPGIGLNHCWFYDKKQQWYYMYSVMTILLATNIFIFLYICLNLWQKSLSTSNIKALKYRSLMTLRLCIVMGLPWVFEMIGSLNGPHIIWIILDIVNSLQGLLIFLLLVVLRKRVVKALYKQGYLECISGLIERHLAVGDDEEEIVQHTIDVTFNTKLGYKQDLA